MNIPEQIEKYIASQTEPKRSEMQELHQTILQVLPECKLWFLDGKNSENKTVSNPNIGYGFHTIKYADGKTREFYFYCFYHPRTIIYMLALLAE